VLLVNSLQSGKAWQECAQQTEKSNSSLCTCPASSTSIYRPIVFFQHVVWYDPTSETAWMPRRQKNWLKYTDFTELKKVTSIIFSKPVQLHTFHARLHVFDKTSPQHHFAVETCSDALMSAFTPPF